MKKLRCILVVAFVASLALASCTDENVTPKTEAGNIGGSGSVDPFKP